MSAKTGIAALCLALLTMATAAWGAEPAWWTQQKRDCGLPANLAYNNWDGSCGTRSGGSSPGARAFRINEDGRAALRAKDYDRAIELFDLAYATNPEQVFLENKKLAIGGKYNEAGHAALKAKDYDRAVQLYDQAYAAHAFQGYLENKKNALARKYAAAASAAWSAKDWNRAADLYDRAYAIDPYPGYLDNKKAAIGNKYHDAGNAALDAKDFDRAVALFEQAYTANPNQRHENRRKYALGRKHAAEASAAWKAKDWKRAADLYDKAYAADPKQVYLDNKRVALDNSARSSTAAAQVPKKALEVADREVKRAAAQGRKPSFSDASNLYQRTRTVAHGLGPEESRCALVLSMTFGLEPRAGEKTLKDLSRVNPDVREAQLASRYYVNAEELANRLRESWGRPHEVVGEDAVRLLRGRKGVIYFDGGFGFSGRGRHIDLWDGTKMSWAAAVPARSSINGSDIPATGTTTHQAISRARKILFWEFAAP